MQIDCMDRLGGPALPAPSWTPNPESERSTAWLFACIFSWVPLANRQLISPAIIGDKLADNRINSLTVKSVLLLRFLHLFLGLTNSFVGAEKRQNILYGFHERVIHDSVTQLRPLHDNFRNSEFRQHVPFYHNIQSKPLQKTLSNTTAMSKPPTKLNNRDLDASKQDAMVFSKIPRD